MYLTYNDYVTMGGQLSSAAYTRYELLARKQIDAATFGRLQDLLTQSDTVKGLMFELINVGTQYISAVTGGSVKKSESVGDYSVSYADGCVSDNDSFDAAAADLIDTYLSGEKTSDGVPLLYCGVVR
jgi:hypothetical protein